MMVNKSPVNMFSIDLEEWFHASLMKVSSAEWHKIDGRVAENTRKILEFLERKRIKATFFVLGWVAEHYPEIVRSIYRAGHEIASHGYGHQLLYQLSEAEFETDLQKSVRHIKAACGVQPLGYRAPSWSVNKDMPWFYPVLARNGFRYDASVFPVKTFLYGIPDAPRFPYTVTAADIELIEIPGSTVSLLGRNLPFAGGFYFRMIPYAVIKNLYRSLNKKGHSVVFYLHPYDLDPDEPMAGWLKMRDRMIQYYGRRRCFAKLERLSDDFRFTSIHAYIRETGMA